MGVRGMRLGLLAAIAWGGLSAAGADVGLNLNWPMNTECSRPFADLAKLAEVSDGGDGGQVWSFLHQAGSAASDGDYTLIVSGKDVEAREHLCWAVVLDGRYDAASDTTSWTVRCPKGPGHESNGIGIRFSRPVTGVRLYVPGVDPKNPPLVNPQFKQFIDKFRPKNGGRFVLRTMDFQHTNLAEIRTLAQIPRPEDPIWSTRRGVPPAVLPKLASETGCDLYICLPACVDEEGMRYYVREVLKAMPGHTYVEVGNEAWNLFMPAWRATADFAREKGFTDPDDGNRIRPWLAKQYDQLDRMLREEGIRSRVTVCVSAQLANPDWDQRVVPLIAAAGKARGEKLSEVVDLLVGSPYWEVPYPPEPTLEKNPDLTADQIMEAAKRVPEFASVGGNDRVNMWDLVDALVRRCSAQGLGWGAYEFGPELHRIETRWKEGGPEYVKLLAAKTAAHDSPLFGEINLAVTRKLIAKGAKVVCYYKAPSVRGNFESLMGISPSLAVWTPLCQSLATAAAEQAGGRTKAIERERQRIEALRREADDRELLLNALGN